MAVKPNILASMGYQYFLSCGAIHGLAPDYLGSLFTKYDPPYNLRNFENKLAVPLPRTNLLKKWSEIFQPITKRSILQPFVNCSNLLEVNL